MNNLATKFVDLLPYVIFVVLVGAILIPIAHFGLTYDHLISLINATIWPAITLCALIFFRKVFTYLFFSIEEFNFFGARGRLNDIQEMIRNKANKLWDDEKNQEKLNAERVEHQKELAEIKNDRDQSAFNRERVVKFAEKLIDENGKLQKQNIELVKKQEMLNLILSKIPQTDSETGVELASIEEIRDVGSTNPVSVTSEIK
ncbi:MAG: hypothetical protein WCS89_01285 [Candidatus Paceibacterota bacterium]